MACHWHSCEPAKVFCHLQKCDSAKLVFNALQVMKPLSVSLHLSGMKDLPSHCSFILHKYSTQISGGAKNPNSWWDAHGWSAPSCCSLSPWNQGACVAFHTRAWRWGSSQCHLVPILKTSFVWTILGPLPTAQKCWAFSSPGWVPTSTLPHPVQALRNLYP